MGPPGMMQASAPYGIEPMSGLPYSDKSKMIAGLLQLFAGAFGVGRFYTGHIGIAIAQIAVVWLTCGAGILWPMIDGIMMLTGRVTDSEGRPLRPG
jgi:TM2 domain-containing membrane protein YozV